MRLWHIDLIPALPKGQLLSQWRELNSIFAMENRHILINYVYDYPKEDLYLYTKTVMEEMGRRGYSIRTFEKMNSYFDGIEVSKPYKPFARYHDFEYLEICYFNLKEKFMRGQKDYDETLFNVLHQLYIEATLKNNKN